MSTNPTPKEEEVIECSDCGDKIPEGDEATHDGEVYCNNCYDERFAECYECGDMHERDSLEYHDDNGEYYCSGCYPQDDNVPEREYSARNLKEFQSATLGKIIKSRRLFSAEIECYYRNSDKLHHVARAFHRAIGISEDGSLNDSGVEFQTPKLKGRKGEKTILEMCATLQHNGFTVDRSAGLHIHLDGKGLLPRTRTKATPTAVKQLWSFYLAFEDVFLSFLPQSRRTNRFCKTLKNDFHLKEIEDCYTLKELEILWYRSRSARQIKSRKSDKYDNTRYAGVNLHSLFAKKHIEIRYHSGTLEAEKILYWVSLHQTILDLAAAQKISLVSVLDAHSLPNLEDKTKAFFNILQLPENSVSYFRARQAKFTSIRADVDEGALTTA